MDAALIRQRLAPHWARLTPGQETPLTVTLLRTGGGLGDGTSLYIVGDQYLLHVSPRAFPHVAEEQRIAIARVKAALPDTLARHIIDVIDHGVMDGMSWMLQPLLSPLSPYRVAARLQRLYIRPGILRWLQGIARLSAPGAEATHEFRQSLQTLMDMPAAPASLRRSAHKALELIDNGSFEPRFTPMHGDLWRGNIMLGARWNFAVIDWRGSRMEGYGIFDLMRYALSDRLSERSLRQQLDAHARAMKIDPAHTAIVLLAGLGHFARHLGEFPEARFMTMAEECYAAWERATGREL